MSIINLLSIYHSFLLKKWYLLLYVFLLFISLILVVGFVANNSMQDKGLTIGLVDQDQTKETEMILATVGDGQKLAEDFSLKPLTDKEAKTQLGNHEVDGYIVFEKGMTESFYANGELPIRVFTYDEKSMQSLTINQLAESVYSRLMLSEGGILTYAKINKAATDDELVKMMIDLLIVGVDREAAFDIKEIQAYDFSKTLLISIFFITIFLMYYAISTIVQMNETAALTKRLSLYPKVRQQIIISRAFFSIVYTTLYTVIISVMILKYTSFETYNSMYFITIVTIYLLAIMTLFMIFELLKLNSLKVFLAFGVILFSGATIPAMYFDVFIVQQQLFAQLFNAFLQLLHNNYVTDWTKSFYVQLLVISLALILLLIGGRKK